MTPPRHATCHPPPLLSGGGGTPSHVRRGQQDGQQQPIHSTPPPPVGLMAGIGWQGHCLTRHSPHASPSLGVDVVGSHAAPSWASLYHDGAQPRTSPPISPPILPPIPPSSSTSAVTRGDFVTLYEQYIANRLKARVAICYTAGQHEVSITCSLSPSSSVTVAPTARRRLCHRFRHATRTLPELFTITHCLRPLPTPPAIPSQ
jgi:hypothetical protein